MSSDSLSIIGIKDLRFASAANLCKSECKSGDIIRILLAGRGLLISGAGLSLTL